MPANKQRAASRKAIITLYYQCVCGCSFGARPAQGTATTTDVGLVLLGCSLLADARTYVPTDWCEGWCEAAQGAATTTDVGLVRRLVQTHEHTSLRLGCGGGARPAQGAATTHDGDCCSRPQRAAPCRVCSLFVQLCMGHGKPL